MTEVEWLQAGAVDVPVASIAGSDLRVRFDTVGPNENGVVSSIREINQTNTRIY